MDTHKIWYSAPTETTVPSPRSVFWRVLIAFIAGNATILGNVHARIFAENSKEIYSVFTHAFCVFEGEEERVPQLQLRNPGETGRRRIEQIVVGSLSVLLVQFLRGGGERRTRNATQPQRVKRSYLLLS